MKLESEGRPAIEDAHASDVSAAVAALSLPVHSFLILTRTRTSYVQVAMQAGERFVIEYREGGPRDFRSTREDFSRNEVAQLLESYLAGGDAWRAGIQWRPVDGVRPRDAWDTVSTVCAFVGLAILIVFGFSIKSEGRGTSHMDPMVYFSIAMLVLLPTAIIDMRRFKEMNVRGKMRTIALFFLAVMAALYWIDR